MSEERLQFLQRHGFTEYQARAYLALLGYSTCTVGELARASRLPRNRLYEVLADLQGMGLVQVRPETPRRYRARPLGDFLRRRAERLRHRAEEIEEGLDHVDDAFRPPEEGGADLGIGATRVLSGRRAVAREVDRMFEAAKESIVITSSTAGLDRVVGYARQGTAARAGSDLPPIRLEVVVPQDARGTTSLTAAESLFTGGVTIVDADLRLTTFVRDEEELLSVQALPEDHRLRMGEDFGILTTNPALVHDHLAFLRLVGHHTTHPS